MCALPTILETGTSLVASIGAGGKQRLSGTSGVETVLRIYQCTGLTSTYTRTLAAHASGIVIAAKWSYGRIGGAGAAELLVKGGLADMDTAVSNEWEVELERGDPVVWYRGRIVAYKHETTPDGDTVTRLYCEGYLTKLAQLKVDKDYTSSTVKVIVQDLLDTYVTGNTRIAYTASDVVGAYTVNSVSFKGRTVLEAIEMLGMLQGSTEWGVTEGNPKPQFYFIAEGSGAGETQVMQLGKDAKSIAAEGSFQSGYSTVKVIGGWSGGAIVTGTYTDATAQTSFGKREKVISDSAVLNETDANRLAQNYATVYANGNARYAVDLVSPSTRVEPDRTGAGAVVAAKKATIRGQDSGVTDFFGSIEYTYRQQDNSGPQEFSARVKAGLPEECVQAHVTRLARTVESLVQQVQQIGGAVAAHNVLSATHGDTTAASVARGDLMVGKNASPKWEHLALGSAGKFPRSDGTDLVFSTLTIPNTITAKSLLFSSAADALSEVTMVANAILYTDANKDLAAGFDIPNGVTYNGATIATTSGSNTFTGTTTLTHGGTDQNLKTLANGSVELGKAGALATNATDGFAYVPTMAGAPSGTPTSVTGKSPIVIDTTNGRLYTYYGGAWHYATLT